MGGSLVEPGDQQSPEFLATKVRPLYSHSCNCQLAADGDARYLVRDGAANQIFHAQNIRIWLYAICG